MSRDARLIVDGQEHRVPEGTMLAAALMNLGVAGARAASGGERRGPWCGIGLCFDCRVTLDGRAHIRACTVTVVDGMEVRTGGS